MKPINGVTDVEVQALSRVVQLTEYLVNVLDRHDLWGADYSYTFPGGETWWRDPSDGSDAA